MALFNVRDRDGTDNGLPNVQPTPVPSPPLAPWLDPQDFERGIMQTADGLPGGGLNPDKLLARLTREQFEDYKTRFWPIEQSLLTDLSPEGRARRREHMLNRARSNTNTQFDVAAGVTDRNIRRYGLTLNDEQRDRMAHTTDLSRASTMAGSENVARQASEELDDALMRAATETGREIAGQSTNMAGNAASMWAQRQAANRAIDAQNRAGRYQTLGTLGSLAIMAMMMSSRKLKRNIKPVSSKKADEALRDVKVKEFNYRENSGMPTDEKFVGMIAEEAPKMFKGRDGLTVNMNNVIGALVKSNQNIDRRLSKIEKRTSHA